MISGDHVNEVRRQNAIKRGGIFGVQPLVLKLGDRLAVVGSMRLMCVREGEAEKKQGC